MQQKQTQKIKMLDNAYICISKYNTRFQFISLLFALCKRDSKRNIRGRRRKTLLHFILVNFNLKYWHVSTFCHGFRNQKNEKKEHGEREIEGQKKKCLRECVSEREKERKRDRDRKSYNLYKCQNSLNLYSNLKRFLRRL